jgi:hypothetical protein
MQQVPPESGAPGESDTEEAIVPTDMNLLTGKSFLFIFWISHSFVLMNFGLFRNGLSEPSQQQICCWVCLSSLWFQQIFLEHSNVHRLGLGWWVCVVGCWLGSPQMMMSVNWSTRFLQVSLSPFSQIPATAEA